MKPVIHIERILSTIDAVNQQTLRSEFKDFEDAIQYYYAVSLSQIECIVTRNSKDFKKFFPTVMAREKRQLYSGITNVPDSGQPLYQKRTFPDGFITRNELVTKGIKNGIEFASVISPFIQ